MYRLGASCGPAAAEKKRTRAGATVNAEIKITVLVSFGALLVVLWLLEERTHAGATVNAEIKVPADHQSRASKRFGSLAFKPAVLKPE